MLKWNRLPLLHLLSMPLILSHLYYRTRLNHACPPTPSHPAPLQPLSILVVLSHPTLSQIYAHSLHIDCGILSPSLSEHSCGFVCSLLDIQINALHFQITILSTQYPKHLSVPSTLLPALHQLWLHLIVFQLCSLQKLEWYHRCTLISTEPAC